ncbi:hypothetical protein HA402_006279 [Bradysia odoriphaga]|nr:hypothetical protein HA402_006279 [Bradysia odoriphaga]
MNQFTVYDPLDSEDHKFGEIYCNYEGKLTFTCVFCPIKFKDAAEFSIHYIVHVKEVFEIKTETEVCVLEPNVEIDEPQFQSTEIKSEPSSDAINDDSKVITKLDFEKVQPENVLDRSIKSPRTSSKTNAKESDKKFDHPHRCNVCSQEFILKSALDRHTESHGIGLFPSRFECDICGSKVKLKKDLRTHMRRKHIEDKIPCTICGKVFCRKNYLSEHMKTHVKPENRPFKCEICRKGFVTAKDVEAHMKRHDPAVHLNHVKKESDKKFENPARCHICSQQFIVKKALDRHIESHGIGIIPLIYECDICNAKIKQKKDLRTHMQRLHSGHKATCGICGKQFARSNYLYAHIRIHENYRPHQCFVCGKTFVMAGDLTSHMRKHTKTEPTIPCTICWKMFERPGQLSEHMRLHTNERPFECKVCGSRFRTKGYFNIHKTTHWIGRNFSCELCGVTFKNPTGVRTHMFKVHGKNAATIRRQKKKNET